MQVTAMTAAEQREHVERLHLITAEKWRAWKDAEQHEKAARKQLAQLEREQEGALSAHMIRALLKKVGFTPSTSSPSAVRGWHYITPGFEVRQVDARIVFVGHRTGTYGPDGSREAEQTYMAALENAGFTCTLANGGFHVKKAAP